VQTSENQILEDLIGNIEPVGKFIESLYQETDRGCALIAAAFLDDALSELLKKNLIKDKKILDRLFESNQAFGGFSSKIDVTYALGLIGKNVCQNLQLIRKIRNDFAHIADPIGFEHPPIKSRCSELTLHTLENNAKPRRTFTRVVSSILAILHVEKVLSSHPNIKKDLMTRPEFKKKFKKLLAEVEQLVKSSVK
jgi:DNA-binding MltR family transcriptional regulator